MRKICSKSLSLMLSTSLFWTLTETMAMDQSQSTTTSNKACQTFAQNSPEGTEFWQKKESFCGGYSDEFIESYTQATGFAPNIAVYAFSSLSNWTPDQELPWDDIGYTFDDAWKGKWPKEFFLREITADNLEDKIDVLKYWSEMSNTMSKIYESEYQKEYDLLAQHKVSEKIKKLENEMNILINEANDIGNKIYSDEGYKLKDESPEQYQTLENKYDALRPKIDEKSKNKDALKELLETSYANMLNSKRASIFMRIYSNMLLARHEFLKANQDSLPSLFSNYFKYQKKRIKPGVTTVVLERYKDDLNKGWLDVMPSDFYFGTEVEPTFSESFLHLKAQFKILKLNPDFEQLKSLINSYHNIPKTNSDLISERINALKSISAFIGNLSRKPGMMDESDKEVLQQIAVRANLKAAYLAKLPALEAEAVKRAYMPEIPLVDVKVEKLHDLDPEKRHGHKLTEWYEALAKDPTTPSYFLWLESQDTSDMTKDLRHTFLTQVQKRVNFKDGFAYNEIFRGKDSGHVTDGRYVYNIGQDGELYILPAFETLEKVRMERSLLFQMAQYPDNRTLQEELNHDTVMGGANVMVAGIVIFKQGKIVHIDTNSGHYRPKMIQHLRPALERLLEKHPGSIESTTIIGDYDGKIKMPYEAFLKASPKDVGEEDYYMAGHERLKELGFLPK